MATTRLAMRVPARLVAKAPRLLAVRRCCYCHNQIVKELELRPRQLFELAMRIVRKYDARVDVKVAGARGELHITPSYCSCMVLALAFGCARD